jgi:glycosyltransferase involved in cell wall biosynthesis
MSNVKTIFRSFVRPFALFAYSLTRSKKEKSHVGQPLKPGITAVIAMKNEDYTIGLCLESLVGFADQIVVIDNGSTDKSLEIAYAFKEKFKNLCEVDIFEMPNALLGDCRDLGLKNTRFQWHLRWDADMIAYSNGPNDIKKLKPQLLKSNKPRTYQLTRINLYGDLEHTIGKVLEAGEPWLVWFNQDLKYQEFGKFDALQVPYYYEQIVVPSNHIFHCSGTKSLENLIHRFHYFTWREFYNSFSDANRPKQLEDFEVFKNLRNQYLFDSIEPEIVHYRYNRQLSSQFKKFDLHRFSYFPEVIQNELLNTHKRFVVCYKNKEPFYRFDAEDPLSTNWESIQDEWDIKQFFKRIEDENIKFYTKVNHE